MPRNAEFRPKWVSPPGETIADILQDRNLSLAELAQRMARAPKQVNELLDGRAAITSEVARQLASILGGSADFWRTRESQYRADLSRLRKEARSAVADEKWLREIPVRDMINFGWIKPESSLTYAKEAACLRFFGVPDAASWRATYRNALEMAAFRTSASLKSQPGAVAAWLRRGETESALIDCRPLECHAIQGDAVEPPGFDAQERSALLPT